MLLEFAVHLLLVGLVTFGLAWPIAHRLWLDPAEKLVASMILSLLGIFALGWLTYVAALPAVTLWLSPFLAVAGLYLGRRTLVATLRDPTVRALLLAQLLVTVWCLIWLSLVASYSGGGWAADWFEHWERARFWLERGPLDTRFLGSYAVTARPPLINIVTGVFLTLTRVDFAHYQIIATFLASLAFLPAALLAHRFGGPRAIPILAVLFAVNPLFVQNATFSWTKLPTAACVLAALYFFLRAHDPSPPRAAPALFAACLATGLLAHFSAGPAAVMLALAWLIRGWPRGRDPEWWRVTVSAALVGAGILSLWLVWSLTHYGLTGTLLSNSSVTSLAIGPWEQLQVTLLNFRDTFLPHFLRPLDTSLIAQRSPWGWWRDQFFQCYQLNLFLSLGSVAWLALFRTTARIWVLTPPGARWFWTSFVAGTIFLGVATHSARDTWGLTHISLQPIILLGLVFLAAHWSHLGRPWRLMLIAGASFDVLIGIALHFLVQGFLADRWLAAHQPAAEWFSSYNEVWRFNLRAKIQQGYTFVADLSPAPPALALALLAAILALMLARARATSP
jgi:hypothetical protein